MKWLVISNPKPLNINAIECIGGTDKTGEGFIGRFGSGMKYAVAAALRNGIDLRICTNGQVITFGTKRVDLDRGSVDRITMKIDTASPKPRDWTLDMGKFDWRDKPEEGLTVDWMIFREFLCNAMDEGGCTIGISNKVWAEPGITRIYMRLTDRMQYIKDNMNLFINRGFGKERESIESNTYGHVYPKYGSHGRIYCKGIFVRETKDSLLFDYDFNSLALTESRTVDIYNLASSMGNIISYSSEKFLATMFKKLSEDDKCFESTWATQYIRLDSTKSQNAFIAAFGENAYMAPDVLPAATISSLNRSGKSKIILPASLRTALTGCGVTDYIDVIGRDVVNGFDYIPMEEVTTRVDPELNELCSKAYHVCMGIFKPKGSPEFKYFNWVGSPEGYALGNANGKGIGINCQIPKNPVLILGTMIEEFAHFTSGAADDTRELTNCLVNKFAEYVLQNS